MLSVRRSSAGVLLVACSLLLGALAACTSSGDAAAPSSTVAGVGLTPSLLHERWRAAGLPATASLFIAGDHVVAAGELDAGSRSSETIAVVDLATGATRWSHPLRNPGADPEAVQMRSDILRVLDTGDAVFLASFVSGNGGDPIVGFDGATGVRRFPPADQIDAYRVEEDLVGASTAGVVSNVGIVRDRQSGVAVRYKDFSGFVLGAAGDIGFSWTAVDPNLKAYDINTDEIRWTTPVVGRPNLIVVDATHVIVADEASWRIFDTTTATHVDLPLLGRVNELSTVVTCTTNGFQAMSVGQFGSPATCDGRFVAFTRDDRLFVADTAAGTTVEVAACDPTSPFTVSDGLLVCSTGRGNSRLSIRMFDATNGVQVGKYDDDDLRAPAGLAFQGGVLVVSFTDNTFVAYDVQRPVTG